MKANIIIHDDVKYISIPDLINYLDNTAMEWEAAKKDHYVETLNKLADILGKANDAKPTH